MIDYEKLGRSGKTLHPFRKLILEDIEREGSASPVAISERHKQKLGNISHHCKVMKGWGWIRVDREIPRRGAMEHMYVLTDEAPMTKDPEEEAA